MRAEDFVALQMKAGAQMPEALYVWTPRVFGHRVRVVSRKEYGLGPFEGNATFGERVREAESPYHCVRSLLCLKPAQRRRVVATLSGGKTHNTGVPLWEEGGDRVTQPRDAGV